MFNFISGEIRAKSDRKEKSLEEVFLKRIINLTRECFDKTFGHKIATTTTTTSDKLRPSRS